MKISPYGLIVLAILGICTPALVLAETENEANEVTNDIRSKQTNIEQEGGAEHSTSSADPNLILFVSVCNSWYCRIFCMESVRDTKKRYIKSIGVSLCIFFPLNQN